jgi:F-type H+-transporting ATPase subunit b
MSLNFDRILKATIFSIIKYWGIKLVQVGLDYTLFIQILQFFIIVFLVNIFIVKPLYSTVQKRNAKVASLLERAQAAAAAVDAKKIEYEEKLAAARHEIAEYQNTLRADASRKASDITEKAKNAANLDIDRAVKDIERDIARERDKLKGELQNFSEQIILSVLK